MNYQIWISQKIINTIKIAFYRAGHIRIGVLPFGGNGVL